MGKLTWRGNSFRPISKGRWLELLFRRAQGPPTQAHPALHRPRPVPAPEAQGFCSTLLPSLAGPVRQSIVATGFPSLLAIALLKPLAHIVRPAPSVPLAKSFLVFFATHFRYFSLCCKLGGVFHGFARAFAGCGRCQSCSCDRRNPSHRRHYNLCTAFSHSSHTIFP